MRVVSWLRTPIAVRRGRYFVRMKSVRKALLIAVAFAMLLSLPGCMGNTHVEDTLGGLTGCVNNCSPNPEFLYATSPDHISGFTINLSTGALGTPVQIAGPNQSIG